MKSTTKAKLETTLRGALTLVGSGALAPDFCARLERLRGQVHDSLTWEEIAALGMESYAAICAATELAYRIGHGPWTEAKAAQLPRLGQVLRAALHAMAVQS